MKSLIIHEFTHSIGWEFMDNSFSEEVTVLVQHELGENMGEGQVKNYFRQKYKNFSEKSAKRSIENLKKVLGYIDEYYDKFKKNQSTKAEEQQMIENYSKKFEFEKVFKIDIKKFLKFLEENSEKMINKEITKESNMEAYLKQLGKREIYEEKASITEYIEAIQIKPEKPEKPEN